VEVAVQPYRGGFRADKRSVDQRAGLFQERSEPGLGIGMDGPAGKYLAGVAARQAGLDADPTAKWPGRTDGVDASCKRSEPQPVLLALGVEEPAAALGEEGEGEDSLVPVAFDRQLRQRVAFQVGEWRDDGYLGGCELGDEGMFLEYSLGRPPAWPVEFGYIFDAPVDLEPVYPVGVAGVGEKRTVGLYPEGFADE